MRGRRGTRRRYEVPCHVSPPDVLKDCLKLANPMGPGPVRGLAPVVRRVGCEPGWCGEMNPGVWREAAGGLANPMGSGPGGAAC